MARRKVDKAAEAFIRALADARIQEVRPENRTRLLEWIQENAADLVHKFDTITPAKLALLQFDRRGEKNTSAKLTEAQVRIIKRTLLDYSHHGLYQELSRDYGVTTQTIYNIRDGKTWKHVQADPKPQQKKATENGSNRQEE